MNKIEEKRNRVGKSNKWFLTIPSIHSDNPGELGCDESAIRKLLSTFLSFEGEEVRILLVVERGTIKGATIAEAVSGSESIKIVPEEGNNVPESVHHFHIYVEYPSVKQLYNKHFDYLGKHGHLVPYVKLDTIESAFIKPGFKEIKEENYKKREKNAFFIMFQYLSKETKIVFTTIKTSERSLKLNKFIREKNIMLKNIEESKAIGREIASQNLKVGGFNKMREAKREVEKSVRSAYLAEKLLDFNFFRTYLGNYNSESPNTIQLVLLDPIFKELLLHYQIKGKKAASATFFREVEQRDRKWKEKQRSLKEKIYQIYDDPVKAKQRIVLEGGLAAMRNSRWANYKAGEVKELFKAEGITAIRVAVSQFRTLFKLIYNLLDYRNLRTHNNLEPQYIDHQIVRDNNFIIYSESRKVGKTTFLATLCKYFSTFKMPTRTSNLTNWADWRDDIISWDEVCFKTFEFNSLLQFLQGSELLVGGIDVPKRDHPVIIGTTNKTVEGLFKESYKKGNWNEDKASLDTRIEVINLEFPVNAISVGHMPTIKLFSISEFIERVFLCQIAIGIVSKELKESRSSFIKELEGKLFSLRSLPSHLGVEERESRISRKDWLTQLRLILKSSLGKEIIEEKLKFLRDEYSRF